MELEERLGSGKFAQVKPIQVGEAAAIGQKLAGREKWVKVDASGKATRVQLWKNILCRKMEWGHSRRRRNLHRHISKLDVGRQGSSCSEALDSV